VRGSSALVIGDDWFPQIIVKLHDEVQLSKKQVADYLTKRIAKSVGSAKSLLSIRILLDAISTEDIKKLMRQAELADPTYQPRNLLNYFRLSVPPHIDVKEVLSLLRSLPIVETAYIALRGENPQVDPDNDPEFRGQ